MNIWVLGSCTIVGFVLGCTYTVPDHCASKDGDASCAENRFCSRCEPTNDGCVTEKPGADCYFPGPTTVGSSTTNTTVSEVTEGPTTGSTSVVGLDSTTSASTGGCVDDDQCTDQAAPFCDPSGECIGCDEQPDPSGACIALGEQTPICSRGMCVGCDEAAPDTCVGQTPVCAGDEGCRACVEHFECPSAACHLDGDDVGACFDMAQVMSVSDAAELSVAVAGLRTDDRMAFLLDPGFYPLTIDIGDSAEIAIIGMGEDAPVLTGDGARAVEVFGNAIMYLSNVRVSNSNASGDGLECSGRSAWVDDSRLEDNRFGIAMSGGCFVHTRRTLIADNSGGGIDSSGGDLSLRNSAVSLNGNGFSSEVGGFRLTNTTVEITYTTIAANESMVPGEASISCIGGGEMGEVRNSIIVGAGQELGDCVGIMFASNAVDTGIGGSNIDVGSVMATWFTGLGTGDLHLSPEGAMVFGGIAQWQMGDPVADIDGDPIPSDMSSVPGYDQP